MHHLFAQPWLLLCLAILPAFLLLGFLAKRRRRRLLAAFGDWHSVQRLIHRQNRWRLVRAGLFTVGLITLIGAAAGPQWGRDWNQATAPGRDIVIVLDVSRSMLAEQPSRYSRALADLDDLLASFKKRGGHRVGLVVFAGQAKSLCPLTHDYDHLREVLEDLDPELLAGELQPKNTGEIVSGTRIGLGLVEATRQQDNQPEAQGYQDILLISDGDDPAGDQEWRKGIKVAEARKIPVHVVGVGDPANPSRVPFPSNHPLHDDEKVLSKLEEDPLKEIARLTSGVYISARTEVCPLGKLYREQMEGRALREDSTDALPVYQQHASWFFVAALVMFTMEMSLAELNALVAAFARTRASRTLASVATEK
jgi:Ca-activated chloride channel family protein